MAANRKAKDSTPYDVVRLESWDEVVRRIADSPYSNWAFRGQTNQSWPLESTLARYFRSFRVHRSAWVEQEERILRIFKRKAHHFLSLPPAADDEFEWLALMQHHGAPTRLLDFTWSPYLAAFFALERATGEAAIWALNPTAVNEVATQRTGTADPNPRLAGNLRRYFLRNDLPVLWVDEPLVMNRRLIAQLGTFAIPGILTKPMDQILSAYPHPKKILVKFVLPAAKVRKRGLRELYRMNITYERLFPDLDGLARSLAYELEFHWQFDPYTMKRYADF